MKKGLSPPEDVQPTTWLVFVAQVCDAGQVNGADSVLARHPHVVSSTQVLSDCRFNLAQSCLLRASSNDGPEVGLGVHPFAPS